MRCKCCFDFSWRRGISDQDLIILTLHAFVFYQWTPSGSTLQLLSTPSRMQWSACQSLCAMRLFLTPAWRPSDSSDTVLNTSLTDHRCSPPELGKHRFWFLTLLFYFSFFPLISWLPAVSMCRPWGNTRVTTWMLPLATGFGFAAGSLSCLNFLASSTAASWMSAPGRRVWPNYKTHP